MKKYKLVVSGGTFDKFHKGHQDFLTHQLALSDRVLLGITTDTYAAQKTPDPIDPYEVRKHAVITFLQSMHAEERVDIEPIESVYIPSKWLKFPIEAIVVTEDTVSGAHLINRKRKKFHLSELPIEIFSLTPAEDNKPISSSRIRKGEISKKGLLYVSQSVMKRTFHLPDQVRVRLKKPFGDLIKNNKYNYLHLSMHDVITVGDVATKTFLERDLLPRIAIVDFVVERKKVYDNHTEIGFSGKEIVLSAVNPPGSITPSLFRAISQAFTHHPSQHIVIAVTGEEDLAVIPVLLHAPLGSHIFYGQPGEGIVKVDVTEERKNFALDLLASFKI